MDHTSPDNFADRRLPWVYIDTALEDAAERSRALEASAGTTHSPADGVTDAVTSAVRQALTLSAETPSPGDVVYRKIDARIGAFKEAKMTAGGARANSLAVGQRQRLPRVASQFSLKMQLLSLGKHSLRLGKRSLLRAITGLVALIAVTVMGYRGMKLATGVHSVPRAGHTFWTSTGEQVIVTLRDSSRVTLAPRSRLQVADGFGGKNRTVTLDGEGYFDIRSTTGAPFIVQSGMAVARVLGTTFGVRHYTTDSKVQVAVTSGRVSVVSLSQSRSSMVLTAGRVGDVTDSAAIVTQDSAVPPTWMTGTISFHEALASDVLATLTRWYGYEFRYADPTLGSRNLTMVVSTHSSAQSLSALKILLDVDLTFDGNVVTLHPRRVGGSPVRRGNQMRDAFKHFPSEVGR